MKRHRNEAIGIGEQLGASTVHPLRKRGRQMKPVAMLQGQDEVAARLVIAHGGAGAIVRRGLRGAGAAQPTGAEIERKGIAARGAARASEKRNPAPTTRAQCSDRADRRAAAKAARRQNEIEETGPKAPQAQRGSGVQHGIILIRGG